MKKEFFVNREISFTVKELLEHLDEDFKEMLCTALLTRDLSHVICYSKFSDKIDFSLMHSEFIKEL